MNIPPKQEEAAANSVPGDGGRQRRLELSQCGGEGAPQLHSAHARWGEGGRSGGGCCRQGRRHRDPLRAQGGGV